MTGFDNIVGMTTYLGPSGKNPVLPGCFQVIVGVKIGQLDSLRSHFEQSWNLRYRTIDFEGMTTSMGTSGTLIFDANISDTRRIKTKAPPYMNVNIVTAVEFYHSVIKMVLRFSISCRFRISKVTEIIIITSYYVRVIKKWALGLTKKTVCPNSRIIFASQIDANEVSIDIIIYKFI